MIPSTLLGDPLTGKYTRDNQRLEKWVGCVLLLHNWDLLIFWLTTYYRHERGHSFLTYISIVVIRPNYHSGKLFAL